MSTVNPAAAWWRRLLFRYGPHFIARRIRVLRSEDDGTTT